MSTIDMMPFAYEGHAVRVQTDDTGTIWFCGSDVAECLGYSRPNDAIRQHCREGGTVKRRTPSVSGEQEMLFIDEPNVYRLAIRSRLPSAEAFERWVFEEVLPQIRKTGRYAPPAPPPTATHVTIPLEEYVDLRVAAAREEQVRALLPAYHADHRTRISGERPVFAKKKNRPCTEGDLDFIKAHWGKMPTLTIAQRLDRSPQFVRHHAKRLGFFVASLYLPAPADASAEVEA